jgi:hypothetical protein
MASESARCGTSFARSTPSGLMKPNCGSALRAMGIERSGRRGENHWWRHCTLSHVEPHPISPRVACPCR